MKNTEFRKMVTDAVDKLLVQNKQSVAPFGGGCKYRGPDNTCKDQISFLMDLQAIHDIIPEEGFDFNHSFIKEVKSAGNLHWVAEHIDNKEVK